jgi:hypothetical protein
MFKPPLNHRRSTTELIEEKTEPDPRRSVFVTERRTANVQNAKDEIENLMSRITGEIKKIDVEKGVSKANSPEVFITQEFSPKCLANSTLKNFKCKKETMNFIKSSLGGAMKRDVKKQTSPRVILRAQTIMNYQV